MKTFLIAALLAAVPLAAAAADPERTNVRGTVTAIAGDTVTVETAAGPQMILVPPETRISLVVKASLTDIAPGTYIGTAAVPQPDGSRPYDLAPSSSMTNGSVTKLGSAKVDRSDARVLTVTYEGGEKQIVVTPSTPVVTTVPGTRDALVPGAHVIVTATKSDAGTLTAQRVSVGKDGLTPPM